MLISATSCLPDLQDYWCAKYSPNVCNNQPFSLSEHIFIDPWGKLSLHKGKCSEILSRTVLWEEFPCIYLMVSATTPCLVVTTFYLEPLLSESPFIASYESVSLSEPVSL